MSRFTKEQHKEMLWLYRALQERNHNMEADIVDRALATLLEQDKELNNQPAGVDSNFKPIAHPHTGHS